MRLETFSRVLEAMRPGIDRITVEADLVHQMRMYRETGSKEDTEFLLDAAGRFFGRMSQHAIDAHLEDVYKQLRTAWYEVCIAYENGDAAA